MQLGAGLAALLGCPQDALLGGRGEAMPGVREHQGCPAAPRHPPDTQNLTFRVCGRKARPLGDVERGPVYCKAAYSVTHRP